MLKSLVNEKRAMRNYRKFDEVRSELFRHILALRGAGTERLESERRLAEIFCTGRPTISKVLQQLKAEGVIVYENQRIFIPPFRQHFRYAYIASVNSINNTFWFSAYQRLWNELAQQARQVNIEVEFVEFDPEIEVGTLERFIDSLRGFDLCFLSLVGRPSFLDIYRRFREENRQLFLLDENMESAGGPLLCLGNFEVGAVAAKLLLKRGYCKTAVLAPMLNISTRDFRRRIEGFTATMTDAGGHVELFSSNLRSQLEELTLLRRCINHLPRRGFDSVFYLDDYWVMLTDNLIENGLIPEFGILAVDGTMAARGHQPPIDTVSHATVQLAARICEIILARELGGFRYDPTQHIRLPPIHLPGKTLRAD